MEIVALATRDKPLSQDRLLSPTKGEGPLGETLSPTIICKPSKCVALQSSSIGKNVQFDFTNVPIKKPQALEGATDGGNM